MMWPVAADMIAEQYAHQTARLGACLEDNALPCTCGCGNGDPDFLDLILRFEAGEVGHHPNQVAP